jgi:hypothetical protein
MRAVERATSERGEAALPELITPATRQGSEAPNDLPTLASGRRRKALEPRLVVGLLLIAAAVVWAVARGLEFYGLSPVNLAYDVDQPPLLLAIVAVWFWYRSRRR